MKTKPLSSDLWDMADYANANQSLLSQIIIVETQLRARGEAIPSRSADCTSPDIITANDALNVHLAILSVKASNSAPAIVEKKDEKKLTLTERVMAAKKVTKISDLPTPMD
jgi:hypothetical protein